jgi:hypothetical protein
MARVCSRSVTQTEDRVCFRYGYGFRFEHLIGKIIMQTGPSDTFVAHKAISLAEDLTGTEKRVAATIIDHFNRKTGRCDPALGSIARLLGVSRARSFVQLDRSRLKVTSARRGMVGTFIATVMNQYGHVSARMLRNGLSSERRAVGQKRQMCHLWGDKPGTLVVTPTSPKPVLITHL